MLGAENAEQKQERKEKLRQQSSKEKDQKATGVCRGTGRPFTDELLKEILLKCSGVAGRETKRNIKVKCRTEEGRDK